MPTAPATQDSQETPPDEIVGLVQEGKQALERGDLDLALQKFEAVVNRFPDRPEGHNNLGALYTSLGRLEKAEHAFSRVLNILPGNANVHYNRGIVRIRREDFPGAIADFDEVLSTCPEDADCWNNLGVAHFMKGDHHTSRGHFQQALELVPEFPNALLNLCDAEIALGHRPAALTLCSDYLACFGAPEVRRKQLELLTEESRDCLIVACDTAELLLVEGDDPEVRQHLERLTRARDALAAGPAG